MEITETYRASFGSEWTLDILRATVRTSRRAVVVAHTNADGDAVGSVCAMSQLLRAAGVAEAMPILPDGCPEDMAWLPTADGIASGKTQADRCQQLIAEADLIVAVDVNSFSRTGELEPWLQKARATKVLVDHHEEPSRGEFDVVVSEPEVSSACELVFWLMRQCFGESLFNRQIATCLYAGICTDTGTFSYSNDRPSLYLAAAHLLSYGIDPMQITRSIRNVFTTRRLQFFGFALAERLRVYEAQGVALMTLTASDMQQRGVESSELTGLINEVMRLRAVDCAVLVREEAGKVRLSLRSKERYDVNQIAAAMFGGGGHRRAAGATSLLSLGETLRIVYQTFGLEA